MPISKFLLLWTIVPYFLLFIDYIEEEVNGTIHTDENGITCKMYPFLQSLVDVDGLCMNCGKQGHNRLMMTRIPNFREIIIVAFECT